MSALFRLLQVVGLWILGFNAFILLLAVVWYFTIGKRDGIRRDGR